MANTITFVTNQYACDRIILAARKIADQTDTELVVVQIDNPEYRMDPKAIDHLFGLAKSNHATMRLMFAQNSLDVMFDIAGQYDSQYIVTGMPSSSESVLYRLWKEFPDRDFFAVDENGELVEVAQTVRTVSA